MKNDKTAKLDGRNGNGNAAGHESAEEMKTVVEYLDLALKAAAARQMSTSELLGTFFYYTHGIAAGAREHALKNGSAQGELTLRPSVEGATE